MDSRTRESKLSFHLLRLTGEKLGELREEADRAVQQALAQCCALQEVSERPLSAEPWRTEHEVHTACKARNSKKPSLSVSQVFGQVEGEYCDLLRCLKPTRHEDLLDVHRMLFSCTTDACELHSIPPLSAFATESINRTAYELFPLRHEADSIHYEANGIGIDTRGEQFAFHVTIPAAFDEVPDVSTISKTTRIFSTSVVIARPHTTIVGLSDVYIMMQNDFRSGDVHRCLSKWLRLSLDAIHAVLTTYRATSDRVDALDLVPKKLQAECDVCVKPFSIFRAKHTCTGCDRSCCRKCLVKVSDVTGSRMGRGRDEDAKMCPQCVTLLVERNQHNDLSSLVAVAPRRHAPHQPQAYDQQPEQVLAVEVPSAEPLDERSSIGSPTSEPECIILNPWSSPIKLLPVTQQEADHVGEEEDLPDVLLTVDTRDMTRTTYSLKAAQTTNNGESLFENISVGLQRQASLLHQMRSRAAAWRSRTEVTPIY